MIVLLVDDEPLIRMGVAVFLEELGHEVMEASNGSVALKCLQENAAIELLLTDFRMPGLSGLDLISQCRSVRPSLKIILMTGYSSEDHIFPTDCPVRLVKPFGIHDLETAINHLC